MRCDACGDAAVSPHAHNMKKVESLDQPTCAEAANPGSAEVENG